MKDAAEFDIISKTAYSHGLEAIYAIENVDLRTLRKLQQNPLEEVRPALKQPRKQPLFDNQLQLELGLGFHTWIPPFFTQEPIRVLGLSKYTERLLHEKGKALLQDLMQPLTGLGQGHLVEIQGKLEEHIAGRESDRAYSLDFAGWIRALFAKTEIKKLHVILEKQGLQSWIAISAAESVELKRLTVEQKRLWLQTLHTEIDPLFLQKTIAEVYNAFIKPWVAKRHGLARKEELLERLERISDDPLHAEQSCQLLNICTQNSFFLEKELFPVEKEIYSIDPRIAEAYSQISRSAESYFCGQTQFYPLHQLVQLIQRERARKWMGNQPGFVEKVLELNDKFRLFKARRKGQKGQGLHDLSGEMLCVELSRSPN